MADILVQLNQADTAAQADTNLKERHLGWATQEHSLVFKEKSESAPEVGVPIVIPSLIGQGMGRRVAQSAHGFVTGQFVRIAISGFSPDWELALADTEDHLASHMVVGVIDANTFDVASSGSWWGTSAPLGPMYLSQTTPGAYTTSKPTGGIVQMVGFGDLQSVHLNIGGVSSTAIDIDNLVTILNQRTDLEANPHGPSEGIDTTGTYADGLIVRQITGVGAAMVDVTCDFSYTPETTESAPNGGRGVASGRHFRTIDGVATDERCWAASSEYGEMIWTFDFWRTTVKDTSIRTAGPAVSGYPNCSRWGTLKFVFMAGTIQSYAWVRGAGRTDGSGSGGVPGIFYAKHLAANYNANGTLKESAWQFLAWSGIAPNGLNRVSSHGDAFAWLGDSPYIVRTDDFATWETVADGALESGSSSYRFSGIANDSYGTWGALSITGELWISTPEAVTGKQGKVWAKKASINVSMDGGATFTAMAHLPTAPISGYGDASWGSLQCGYGLWLACIYQPGATGIAYAYSEDFVNWIVYKSATLLSFYDAGFDGARWYATNARAGATGSAVPPIYQLLVDSISVKRQLVMEKGMAVAGAAYFLDLQNAEALGTDENGRVIKVSGGGASSGMAKVDAAGALGYLWDKIKVAAGSMLTISKTNDTIVLDAMADNVADPLLLTVSLLNETGDVALSGSCWDADYAKGEWGVSNYQNTTDNYYKLMPLSRGTVNKATIYITNIHSVDAGIGAGNYGAVRIGLFDSNGVLKGQTAWQRGITAIGSLTLDMVAVPGQNLTIERSTFYWVGIIGRGMNIVSLNKPTSSLNLSTLRHAVRVRNTANGAAWSSMTQYDTGYVATSIPVIMLSSN